ncbi:sugar phosphate nucleotidyltransferase [Caulobacter segnis]|uniref:Nucleotidyl transferase n=1 Tax=Caulobacter segnis (strain ATCC 21756 / DSM 7131 / JCM 7823 / NBRC 15250 / LMG 17158 / TK0059) TaxID=509190 RepID=D5VJE2_CAUST|nr:sugar phosphate nucleotidyltransferase [Caulobacter segnis]ADG10351.1 Nucleotidyl transferase [Caulobacter segnis ATCC 21756]
MSVRQCVFLVGGLGTRLGDIARDTPKPMLPVSGRPFIEHLLAKAALNGFDRALLLAGHRAEVVKRHIEATNLDARLGMEIAVSVEPEPMGTGGALSHAHDLLEDAFLLLNGDTWFDFDWRALADREGYAGMMALRMVEPADRYETVALDGDRVVDIRARDPSLSKGLINGGVCRLAKAAVPRTDRAFSLEAELLPALCRDGALGGRVFEGAFVDIGLPASLAAAERILASA